MLMPMFDFFRDLPPRGRLGIGAVAAVVAIVSAFSIGVAVGRPDYPADRSPEAGFARDMSTHHAQAVELAMIAFQNASLPEVRELGRDIAVTQQGQIGLMQGWLKVWNLSPNTDQRPMAWMPDGERALDGNRMPGMATREEINALIEASGQQVDVMFLQLMIRHHGGGVHMVDGLLELNPSEPMRSLAQQMKDVQQREIELMHSMLTDLGASPLPD